MTKLIIAITVANVLTYVTINNLKHVKKQAILSMVGKACGKTWETTTWIWETTFKPIAEMIIGFVLLFSIIASVYIAFFVFTGKF